MNKFDFYLELKMKVSAELSYRDTVSFDIQNRTFQVKDDVLYVFPKDPTHLREFLLAMSESLRLETHPYVSPTAIGVQLRPDHFIIGKGKLTEICIRLVPPQHVSITYHVLQDRICLDLIQSLIKNARGEFEVCNISICRDPLPEVRERPTLNLLPRIRPVTPPPLPKEEPTPCDEDLSRSRLDLTSCIQEEPMFQPSLREIPVLPTPPLLYVRQESESESTGDEMFHCV